MMTGHHRHRHSSHRHDGHNGSRGAEEQHRDQGSRERLFKELKERRSRKERWSAAREVVEGNRGTPWWFEMNESEHRIKKWMAEELEDKEIRNANEWNKAQELKQIRQCVYDRDRKHHALAMAEKKWNVTKVERDRKKRDRDQKLQEAWEKESNRWVEELEVADSYDNRNTGPDEDGVTWSRQSLVTINNDIRKRHLSRCIPSLQKPNSRGAHCMDCEDENETGPFWNEVHRLGL
ncbi:hypothetical protein BCIN_13g05170 [Botrytis cinerea B05.10]|uniref:Uncharacterized protein n=2 Tax=Botryotinia fuckeliana TaxID=40559 RepID=A0A384K1N7_BOTFB|nr:hypothetical protein BCIN_13g05170 [Botrytis cinerea B05.10]ATZ56682.1 hypothetical protein BCIN_13g05170 [Botrytis cinerea B05.10]CCD48223.1 hypothetical protein BofuT4_P035160.1 [Botrytis cinerea T4]